MSPATTLKEVSSAAGTVIAKGSEEMGGVRGPGEVTVSRSYVALPATNALATGLIIEVRQSSRIDLLRRAFVDRDEIRALLRGIDYIAKIEKEATLFSQLEATYKTRDDLNFKVFNGVQGELNRRSAEVSAQGAAARLSMEELGRIRERIDTNIQNLTSGK